MTQNGEAGTAAADGAMGPSMGVERVLHRRAFPISDVVALIAAGEKDSVRALERREHARVKGGLAVMKHDGFGGGDRAPLARND